MKTTCGKSRSTVDVESRALWEVGRDVNNVAWERWKDAKMSSKEETDEEALDPRIQVNLGSNKSLDFSLPNCQTLVCRKWDVIVPAEIKIWTFCQCKWLQFLCSSIKIWLAGWIHILLSDQEFLLVVSWSELCVFKDIILVYLSVICLVMLLSIMNWFL